MTEGKEGKALFSTGELGRIKTNVYHHRLIGFEVKPGKSVKILGCPNVILSTLWPFSIRLQTLPTVHIVGM